MQAFPFPDKILSKGELTRDLLYKKIPKEDLDKIANRAWEIGEAAAQELIREYGGSRSIEEIARMNGLIVERIEKDNVVGNVRYFSEYYSKHNKITLYMGSIKKWANMNNLLMDEAEELILSHEYFHFLECRKIGLTSKQYTVPTIKIGPIMFGRSGIRSLSEIGAHGFSRTLYELKGKLDDVEKTRN